MLTGVDYEVSECDATVTLGNLKPPNTMTRVFTALQLTLLYGA